MAAPYTGPPYPTNEECDGCSKKAEFRVLNYRDYEVAVCCRECSPRFMVRFEDKDGNLFNP